MPLFTLMLLLALLTLGAGSVATTAPAQPQGGCFR